MSGGGAPVPRAEQFAISHDGRYLAGWTAMRYILVSGDGAREATSHDPPPFLALWDRATGKRLWRDDHRCCWDRAFSPDDRFLEGGGDRNELVRVPPARRWRSPA